MKVNKTLSLDYSVVQELKLMNNQSAFVNAAILKRLSILNDEQPLIRVSTYQCTVCFKTKKGRADDQYVFCHDCGMNGEGPMIELRS